MTNPTLERAARAAWDCNRERCAAVVELDEWENEPEALREDWRALTRAVLMAVRDLPNGFIRDRRSSFYITEYLEYDFQSVIDAILADGGE